MLANVMLAGEVCQKLSGPADGNICSVFLILGDAANLLI